MPLGTCLTTERCLVTHATTPPRTEPQAPAAGAWYQTKAPARLRPLALLVATITSGTALVILVAAGAGVDRAGAGGPRDPPAAPRPSPAARPARRHYYKRHSSGHPRCGWRRDGPDRADSSARCEHGIGRGS